TPRHPGPLHLSSHRIESSLSPRTTRSFCMSTPLAAAQAARQRNLLFFRDPRRWPAWPFLPLVRRCPGRAEELGLLFDAVGAMGLYGLSATVFLCLCGTPHKVFYADFSVMWSEWMRALRLRRELWAHGGIIFNFIVPQGT